MESLKVLAISYTPMETNIKEDFLVERKMELENIHGKMATPIMVIGLKML